MSKKKFRQQFLAKRNALSRVESQKNSQKLCERLQSQPIFQAANTVLSYCSFRQEPDLQSLLALKKSWGLPRCVGKNLVWHHYQMGDRLVSGKFGITEPQTDLPLLDLEKLDLILVPAVACSKKGDRLGYGGGFYDRFLGSLTQSVTTIGIVFDVCLVADLPKDPWDIPLNYVCTEKDFLAIA